MVSTVDSPLGFSRPSCSIGLPQAGPRAMLGCNACSNLYATHLQIEHFYAGWQHAV